MHLIALIIVEEQGVQMAQVHVNFRIIFKCIVLYTNKTWATYIVSTNYAIGKHNLS